mgnify:CR=1 FL=1
MRGTLKTAALEHYFPLLAVEHDCILSKNAEVTVAYRVVLPELFTLTGAESVSYTHLTLPTIA